MVAAAAPIGCKRPDILIATSLYTRPPSADRVSGANDRVTGHLLDFFNICHRLRFLYKDLRLLKSLRRSFGGVRLLLTSCCFLGALCGGRSDSDNSLLSLLQLLRLRTRFGRYDCRFGTGFAEFMRFSGTLAVIGAVWRWLLKGSLMRAENTAGGNSADGGSCVCPRLGISQSVPGFVARRQLAIPTPSISSPPFLL